MRVPDATRRGDWAAGLPYRLTPAQADAVARGVAEAGGRPGFPYPWADLEANLRAAGRTALPLVGYGSLINAASAARTLPAPVVASARPVVAFGFRRLFNYGFPANVPGRQAPPHDPLARAALNARWTGLPTDLLNGVLVEVPLDHLPPLCAREQAYDLLPAPCLAWEDSEAQPFFAYVLRCPERPGDPTLPTRADLRPQPDYYRLCREGAAAVSVSFLNCWLTTTYLADGVTAVATWEAEAAR